MAESQGRMKELLKSLEEEVKCPVCLEIFTEPKKLSCDHILCTPCLENLVLKSTNKSVTCPECRATNSLQESGASQFPAAHQVNRLIDMYYKTLKNQTQGQVATESPNQSQALCPLHSSQPLALYCETCKKTVCRDCVIFSCSKRNHKYDLIEVIAKKHKEEIDIKALDLRELQAKISAMLDISQGNETTLQSQKLKEKESINDTFDLILGEIMEVKNDITMNMEKRFEEQLSIQQSKTAEFKQFLEIISSALESTEKIDCEQPVIEEIIAQKQILQELYHQVRGVKLQEVQVPRIERKLKFMSNIFNPRKSLRYEWPEYKCNFDKIERLKSLQLNKEYTIDFYPSSLTIKATEIKSKLICSTDNTFAYNTITALLGDAFRLSLTPKQPGKHVLQILYHGAHICGSPIPTLVQLSTSYQSISQAAISEAAGIKCYDNKAYVTSFGKEVHVLELDKTGGFTHVNVIPLPGVNEIIVHQNHFYYTEILEHTVVKADLSGQITATVGEMGSKLGHFHTPNGIAINNKTDEIFVCDTCNHRIQVLDSNLNFIRAIGKEGVGPSEFHHPGHIVLDKESNMYVVEYSNHRVQVFTPRGTHIRFINEVPHPIAADIFRDHIYITNVALSCISVYTLTGDFVTYFRSNSKHSAPECIAFNKNGFIYVTHDRREVIQFRQ